MIDRLETGDIVIISTVLTGLKEYPVIRVEDNKAVTKFRIFNTKVYPCGYVYEYGKPAYGTTNLYWVRRGN